MNERGFTLLEALIAIAILGIVLTGIVSTFLTYLDANTMAEERMAAVAVAQQAIEVLRQQDPATLPDSGAAPLQVINVDDRAYEVVTSYCSDPTYCTADARHLMIEVNYGGRTIYSVESVFTTLR